MLRVEIADQGEHGVRRSVVGVEELGAVVGRRPAEQFHLSVAVVRVGEGVVENLGHERPGKAPVGPPDRGLPDLLLDPAQLLGEAAGGELRRPHAVGLAEERLLQGRGRDDLVVVREVLVGAAVGRAAQPVHVVVETAVRQTFAAAEHQVFEEVREPFPARWLDPESTP